MRRSMSPRNMGKHENAWATLEQKVSGLQLPGTLTNAIAKANQEFFAQDFKASRLNVLKKVIAGEPPGVTADQWSAISLPKLGLLLKVAEAALDVAKDYAAQQQSAAMWKLLVQLAMQSSLSEVLVGGVEPPSRAGPVRYRKITSLLWRRPARERLTQTEVIKRSCLP